MIAAKNRILNDIAHLASSNIFRQFLSLFTAFIRPKLLIPEQYGIWSLFNSFLSYIAYFDLGMRASMVYETSVHKDDGDKEKLMLAQGSAFWAMMGVTFVLIIGIIITISVMDLSDEVHYSAILFCAIIFIGFYHEHRFAELKGYQEFKTISKMIYIRYSLTAVFTVVMLYFLGIYGAFLAILSASFTSALYMRFHGPRLPYIRFELKKVFAMIKFGFPIMSMAISALLLRTLDKWIILFYLGTESVGFYSLGATIVGPMLSIPSSARDVTNPILMQIFHKGSKSEKREAIDNYFITPIMQSAFVSMPLLIGVAYFAIPAFINIALPDYIPGIQAIQWMLIGSFFLALTFPATGLIVANHWQARAVVLMILPLIFNFLFNSYILKNGMGIEGVSIGTGLSFMLLIILLMIFLLTKLRRHLGHVKFKILLLFFSFPLLCANIYVTDELAITLLESYLNLNIDLKYFDIIFEHSLRIAIYILIYSPIILLLWKNKLLSIKV